jgi:RNA polymerase sigma factor (sigma-70 family)
MDAGSDPYQWVLEAVDTHELPLLRYARRLLGDLDLARDAVQHAFVKLCEEPRERVAGRVAPWLYRVCRNKAVDHLRHAGREQMVLDGDAPGSAASPTSLANNAADDPAHIAADHDLAFRLRELLQHLPAPQRETIDLWCEGLTYREIAEITGRQEGHVRVLAHRGLTALRSHPLVRRLLEATDSPTSTATRALNPEGVRS